MKSKIIAGMLIAIFFLTFESNTTEINTDQINCGMLTNSPHCAKIAKKFYLIDPTHKLNWFQADRYCRQQNTHLAVIEDEAEMNAIRAYLEKFRKLDDPKFWIGASDLGSEGTFYDVESGNPLRYTSWGAGLPDNYKGPEDCLNLMLWTEKKYIMNDDKCTYVLRFICEYKLTTDEANKLLLNRVLEGNVRITINNPEIFIINDKNEW